MHPFDYAEPTHRDEALALLREHGAEAKVLAGGASLVILLKNRILTPRLVVNIKRIADLGGIAAVNGARRLGALVTHAQIAASPLIRDGCPLLSDAAAQVASPPIRNMGTIGGNVCHGDPFADLPPALIALGATARVASASGTRSLDLNDFYLDYYTTALQSDEIVTDLIVPLPPPGSGGAYIKMKNPGQDIATIAAAALVTMESGVCRAARVVLASAGPVPVRVREIEAALAGVRPTVALLGEAGELAVQAADPMTDVRGSASYKKAMAGVVARRALTCAFARAGAPVTP